MIIEVFKVFVKLEQNHSMNYLYVLADIFEARYEADDLAKKLRKEGYQCRVIRDTWTIINDHLR